VVCNQQANPKPGSYTCTLFEKGLPRIAQKVGEEAVETVVAALAQDDVRLVSEMAALIYHATVLLVQRGLSWQDVEAELAERFGR
jgi:phosphoribosyl-ATP pyrophosphohydrolase